MSIHLDVERSLANKLNISTQVFDIMNALNELVRCCVLCTLFSFAVEESPNFGVA